MSIAAQSSAALLAILFATCVSGCKEQAKTDSAPAKPSVSATPAAPASTPSAKPEPPPKPRDDCPEGSSGIGTFDKPCAGSGDTRMMEVQYTGKTTEQGPKFAITNKSKLPILYGALSVYFYDKAGKQLKVKSGGKTTAKLGCSGNIFAGHVKPDEKIYVFFSCVKQSDVPEGTDAIEGEVQTVGFADESGTKNEFYWRNGDLIPDERPKGGIKPAKKK